MRALWISLSASLLMSLSCGPDPLPEPADAGPVATECSSLFRQIGRCSVEWRSCNNRDDIGVQCTPAAGNAFDCFCFENGEPGTEFQYVGECPLTNPNRDIVEFTNDECGIAFDGPRE